MKHEPVIMYSREWLEHERRKAWSEGYAEGTLDFTPACSFQLLESQLYAMGTYANILQERARIEQVDLNAPLEGGESGEVPQD